MEEIKEGSRVVVMSDICDKVLKGEVGIVLKIESESVAVEFDSFLDTHSCRGLGKDGHCWSVNLDNIKLVSEGNETEDLKGLLEIGRVIEIREGEKYFILPHKFVGRNGWLKEIEYDENLNNLVDRCYDIVKIFNSPIIDCHSWNFNSIDDTFLELVWKRPIKKVFSEDEKTIAKNINKECKYIARDKHNAMYTYKTKPAKISVFWNVLEDYSVGNSMSAFSHLFQQIQFEDNEPTLISDIIEG